MKQLINWLYPLGKFAAMIMAVGVLCLSSCEYDDSDLKSAMENLNERLAKLETATKQAQSDINNLQIILNAVQNQITVQSVVENEDGSYTITFSNKTITIGGEGSVVEQPIISVAAEGADYYWIYIYADGTKKYVTDDKGNKIKANGKEAIAPQLRINADTEEWEMSVDGGKTWKSLGMKAVGKDGDSFFQSVTSDEDYVYVTLKDGSQFKMIRDKELLFVFGTEKTQYFSFGQEQVVAVKMSGVAKYTISKPDGWRAVLTGEGMKITAPVEANMYAETSGVISVTAIGSNKLSTIAELPVKIGVNTPTIDLSVNGTANSYIVSVAGSYRFNATVQGNGVAGASFDSYTFPDYVAKMSPVSAKLLWMTEKGLIIDVMLDGDNIEFTIPEPLVSGNALVAALDASGNVLWSWHLWIPGFDPNATMQVYDNGFKMMDRDLGALANAPGELNTIGLFYQWGRKDPFVGPDKVYTSNPGTISPTNTCRRPVYDALGNTLDPYNDFPSVKALGDGSIGSVSYATAHPTSFIAGKNAMDWYDGTGTTPEDRNNYLWGNPKGHFRKDIWAQRKTELPTGSTIYIYTDTIRTRVDNVAGQYYSYYYDSQDKTKVYSFASRVSPSYETGRKSIYDPCPPGWRLPQSGMWAGFNGASASDQAKAPWNFNTEYDATKMGRTFRIGAGSAWYQCNGTLDYSAGKYSNYSDSRYWSNDAGNNGSMITVKDADKPDLYYGYFYKYTGNGSATNAALCYFSAISFSSKMVINLSCMTSDGEYKPAVSNAPRIGGQELSGGAVRSMGHSVRCMKAE